MSTPAVAMIRYTDLCKRGIYDPKLELCHFAVSRCRTSFPNEFRILVKGDSL